MVFITSCGSSRNECTVMTSPVSSTSIQNIPSQPIGAYSLNGGNDFRAGHFVVNPPPIKKYSFYDEIYVDPNFYKQLINPKSKAFYSKNLIKEEDIKPKKNKINAALKTAAFLAGIFLAYVYRANIKTFLADAFTKLKKLVKK